MFEKRRIHALLLFLCLVVLVLLYWEFRVIRPARSYLFFGTYDLYQIYVPMYRYAFGELAHFRFPLWNHFQSCGEPFLATLQAGIFYPPHLLYAFVPTPLAMSMISIFHLVLGGVFMFLFCRTIALGRFPSSVAMFVFVFCSDTFQKTFCPPFLTNVIYTPLLFLITEKIFQTRRFGWAVALGLAASLQLLGGWAQGVTLSGYALVLYALARTGKAWLGGTSVKQLRSVWLLLVTAGLIFLSLTAVQTFPTYELSNLSVRNLSGLTPAAVSLHGTKIYRSFQMLRDSVSPQGGDMPNHLYVGLVPTLCVLVSLRNRERRFHTAFFFSLAVLALLLSMGHQTFLYSIYYHLPTGKWFRAPIRFLFLYTISTSVLAAIGAETILSYLYSEYDTRRYSRALVGVTLVACVLTLIVTVSRFSGPLSGLIFTSSRWYFCLLALLVISWLRLVVPRGAYPTVVAVGIIGLLLTDLFSANSHEFIHPQKDPTLLEAHAEAYQFVRKRNEELYQRVATPHAITDYSFNMKAGLLHGIYMVNDHENLSTRRLAQYCSFLEPRIAPTPDEIFWGWLEFDTAAANLRLLDYMSGRYVITAKNVVFLNPSYPRRNARFQLIFDGKKERVYENKEALPRAYVVGEAKIVPQSEDVLETLASEEFDARGMVILEEPAPVLSAQSRATFERSTVTYRSMLPENVVLEVRTEGDGFLVLTDQYFPGWKAYIDGKPTKIYRANYLFRAVALPAGQHEIVFRYHPWNFRLGAAISITAILLIMGYATLPFIRGSRRSQT